MGKYVVAGTSTTYVSQGHGFVGSPSPYHALLCVFVLFGFFNGGRGEGSCDFVLGFPVIPTPPNANAIKP